MSAASDQAVITANGSEVWNNHDSNDPYGAEHHQDQQWVSHAVDLNGIADQTTVEVSWELHTDPGLQFGPRWRPASSGPAP